MPSGIGNRKSYVGDYVLLAQGLKRILKEFNSPFKSPKAKANIAIIEKEFNKNKKPSSYRLVLNFCTTPCQF